MRYWYDLEFLEDGRTIGIISIGIVAEDGREYYAVAEDADWSRIRLHAWLMSNVVPHLPEAAKRRCAGAGPGAGGHLSVKPLWQIAHEVSEFIRAGGEDRNEHQLIAYYSAYDHVALCQLWGRMVDLPAWVPMFSHDLESMARGLEQVGYPPERPEQVNEHNALEDARWNRRFWEAQVAATNLFLASVSVPVGHVLIAEPTAARLIERMLSVGPNEGISDQEEADLRQWWETYDYPPGEPEAGDWPDEEVTDEEQAAMEAQQGAEDAAEDAEQAARVEALRAHG